MARSVADIFAGEAERAFALLLDEGFVTARVEPDHVGYAAADLGGRVLPAVRGPGGHALMLACHGR